VLEIGSGTGQHAVFFAEALSHLNWQPTDLSENLPGIALWNAEADLPNLAEPLALDVSEKPWPVAPTEAVFTANTLHIMSWPQVEELFSGLAGVLLPGGLFCCYGPFNYDGRYTSASNRQFDGWLMARDPNSLIRDLADLALLADKAGLTLESDHDMPANNRLLQWRKA